MSKSSKNKPPSSLTWDMLRVKPQDPENNKFYKTDRLTDLLIILFIFGIAVWFRFYARNLYIQTYGHNYFDLKIADSDPLGFGKFLGLEPGQEASVSKYYDFFSYYIPYVEAYEEGWNPYTGSRVPDDKLGGYVYGPFYIISISIGTIWFGLEPTDSIVFSNIILDGLTYVMVYVLAKRFTGNIIAMFLTLIGSFSPISIFYIAYAGLNAPIMNFSFMLFLWAYLARRDKLTMFFLAFSILTKQFPLFMAMPIGFWMVRRYGFFKGVGYYIQFFIWILLLSVPYILWTPWSYGVRLFLPGGSASEIVCAEGNVATNLFYGFIPLEACFQGGEMIPLDHSLLSPLAQIIFILVNSHILFFGSLFVIAWIGFTGYDYLEERPRLYMVFIAAYYGIAHATIARGLYKYYAHFLAPVFLLAFVVGSQRKSLHLRLGYLLHKGWKTWFSPKYRQSKADATFWLFGLSLLISTLGVLWLILAAIELFTFFNGLYLLSAIFLLSYAIYSIWKPGPMIECKNEEFVSYNTYLGHVGIYLTIAGIFAYLLNFIAKLYFVDQGDAIRNAILMVMIMQSFFFIPLLQNLVTGDNEIYSPFTIDFKQLFIDFVGLFIGITSLIIFHRYFFLIHRYHTTLFILMFSFIFLAMLGNKVWQSAIKVPIKFINRYFEIKNYAYANR